MMDELRDYQLDSIQNVISKINDGIKHLSVVMTAGLGQKSTAFFLANRISSEKKCNTAMIFSHHSSLEQAKTISKEQGVSLVDFFSLKEYIGNPKEYSYIILCDLSTRERILFQKEINIEDRTTISFSTLGQEVLGNDLNSQMCRRVLAYFANITPIVCVYSTKDVIDIRDAKYAGETERIYVKKENLATANWLEHVKIQTINEREEVEKRSKRLTEYMKAFKQAQDKKLIEEQAAEIERLRALLQADEKDKKIEELEAREAMYQEQLKEKDAKLAQQDQMISFQQDILSRFGIDVTIIHDSFEKIQNTRTELNNDLESADESIRDKALKQLQDKVTEIVNELTQSNLSFKDRKYFEDLLIAELTEEIWNRLDDKSKVFLITAKSNYESMIKMKDSETFDYSGVCLLVTKALEVETTKRFFNNYKNYLKRKYRSVSKWPEELRIRKQGKITDYVMDENEFTLGSVVSVLGLKRKYDKYNKNKIIDYEKKNLESYDEFLEYATNNLFRFSDLKSIEDEIKKDYLFIETVRVDYRNPSAHKDRLTITSAKNCLEYVIGIHHMLKEMLSTMKI